MNILKMYILSVFFSSKCSLFHNSNVFGSCIIHILYTGCAKIKKNNSGARRVSYVLRIKSVLKYIIPSVIPHIKQKIHFDINFLSKPSAPSWSIPLRILSQTFVHISYLHSIADTQIVLSFSGFHEERLENVLCRTTGQLLFHSTISTFL